MLRAAIYGVDAMDRAASSLLSELTGRMVAASV
jgi:hypothetical protein